MSQEHQQQPAPFDLQAYISRYDPHSETSLSRLLFLAHHFHAQHHAQNNIGNTTTITNTTNTDANNDGDDSASITRQAFELAVQRMTQSGNHRRYLEEYGAVIESLVATPSAAASSKGGDTPELLSTPLRPRSNSSHHHHATTASSPHTQHHHQAKHIIQQYLDYNPDFVRNSKLDAANRLETMEARLGTAQSHLMKESIRSALLALAEFHKERGELREAWRRVARSREYCANGRQHTQVCLLLVELSVDLREWPSVRETISRAEHTVMSGDVDDPLFHQKLRAAQALSHLAEGRYLESAKIFTSISAELTTQFNSVVSAEDLALYGSLLGLATMDRGMLHSLVIDGVFKGRLELVPAMREALRHYSRAEYGQCLALLQTTIRHDLLLDIHLHTHVPILLDMIRDRCIVQYFQPYSSVSLEKMGNVFGCTVKEMEDVVAKLISNGGVDGLSLGEGARINALDKTLSVEGPKSVERKARRRARVMAAKMGVQFTRNAEGMLLRVACMENGISVQSEKRSGWRNRSGGGRTRDGGGRHAPERMGPTEPFESDESVSDDAMDIDNHIVNPNEYF
mmetsp:Transcript_11235/g.24713  ORF Transcript_11235/g.24713 Transcript_11235/m.24713 type:complete len:571 (+) Transcript_11235:101-1813(+)|eukprot:CAMPEP_0172319942 /NCGR_PEP_ID=MMETSP1058-20130122/39121_1 /TAXON_ID=83371 /ORGANISM="Detonula confervacea, Strain CCMP 353" /LENGTH=570 /DNA_ID=CAMNT_0013035091 /DNA_START=23 /DNA_END=1735 /DNA_ORIENTATION=+